MLDEMETPRLWEPWQPQVGQRVRIRISAECRQEWPHPDILTGHDLSVDGVEGYILERLPLVHPYGPHHPYHVLLDANLQDTRDGLWVRGLYLAAVELEPIDA